MLWASRHVFSFGFQRISLLRLSQSEGQAPFHEVLSLDTSSQAIALRKRYGVSDLSWNQYNFLVFNVSTAICCFPLVFAASGVRDEGDYSKVFGFISCHHRLRAAVVATVSLSPPLS